MPTPAWLAQVRGRWGYRRLHVLLKREGFHTDLFRGRSQFRLLQLVGDLLLSKIASLHGMPPFLR